jgi:uncharacterized protein YndB with AHSA1/START domain
MAEAKAKTKKDERIQQSVQVDCSPDDAFRLFTERFAEWWPLAEGCEIEPWEGGKVLERTRSGEERELGTVLTWDPPHRVEFRWQPGETSGDEQTVDVVFSREAAGTRVTLTHHGWQGAGIEICSLAGTATVRFAEFVLELLVMA